MSVQYADDASQKLTAPDVTAEPDAVTVAVNVTALPDTTEVTALPPEVTRSAVSVGADCDHAPTLLLEATKMVVKMDTRQFICYLCVNFHFTGTIGGSASFFY
jgi:hypothetical protein